MFWKVLENSKRKNEKKGENCQAIDAIYSVTFREEVWKPRNNAFKI